MWPDAPPSVLSPHLRYGMKQPTVPDLWAPSARAAKQTNSLAARNRNRRRLLSNHMARRRCMILDVGERSS